MEGEEFARREQRVEPFATGSRTAVVLGVMLFCVIAVSGQTKPASGSGERPRTRQVANDGAAKLKALLGQRLELFRQMEQSVRAGQSAGAANFVDVQRAAIAVIRADLDLNHSRAERIALQRRLVDATRTIEKAAESEVKQGGATRESLIQARIARIEAQIGLEREQLRPPPRR